MKTEYSNSCNRKAPMSSDFFFDSPQAKRLYFAFVEANRYELDQHRNNLQSSGFSDEEIENIVSDRIVRNFLVQFLASIGDQASFHQAGESMFKFLKSESIKLPT